ncbi:unnamed protein product [Vitrella brassicaformis CCMP3155]|uniref:Uncharacterized protein n=1 Tax=Vitrella brassicaformis (strain CCMP3155) TaxID=1169540 RepID=A0A0G4E9T6_VITBC|nr:unnamed protein product [Vitrella brassicaformis CCMP3155]|eukprot:CEL92417.1 unnamed protein product [Vitrella brassicaformis CCMP3155]
MLIDNPDAVAILNPAQIREPWLVVDADARGRAFLPDGTEVTNQLGSGDIFAEDLIWAGGNVKARRDVIAGNEVTAKKVRAYDSLTAHKDMSVWGDLRVYGGVGPTPAALEVHGYTLQAQDIKAVRIVAGSVPTGMALEYGDIIASKDLASGKDVHSHRDVTARRELRAPKLEADECSCASLVDTRRAIAGAFEVRSSDQPSSSLAEWADSDRSAAYDAFKQLRVRTDRDARLGLASADVQRLLPSAVKTFVPHVHQAADEEDDDSEAAAAGGQAEAAQEMTIDLTQLLYTQMAVIQDLINEKEALTKNDDAMAKTIGSLMGRIARLEQGSGGDGLLGSN